VRLACRCYPSFDIRRTDHYGEFTCPYSSHAETSPRWRSRRSLLPCRLAFTQSFTVAIRDDGRFNGVCGNWTTPVPFGGSFSPNHLTSTEGTGTANPPYLSRAPQIARAGLPCVRPNYLLEARALILAGGVRRDALERFGEPVDARDRRRSRRPPRRPDGVPLAWPGQRRP
jgi:hypothetical protein